MYREQITCANRWAMLVIVLASIVLYYILKENVAGGLIVSIAMVMYAMLSNGGLLDNKISAFLVELVWKCIFRICLYSE